jgi:hypothetical protein
MLWAIHSSVKTRAEVRPLDSLGGLLGCRRAKS